MTGAGVLQVARQTFGRASWPTSATGPSDKAIEASGDADVTLRSGNPEGSAGMNEVDYDAELQKHNQILQQHYGLRPDDHVLDIGCGAGQTTRDAARMATAGTALGVDVSASMIEWARQLTEATRLPNVYFELANAATYPFRSESFDVAISRFGTMFFTQPVAAFSNVRRALRPGGRLVMMVWREHDRNEWSVLIERALAHDTDALAAAPEQPDAFSLADPKLAERTLNAAGFVEVSFTDLHVPVYYGPDVAAALAWIRGFSSVKDMLQRLGPASAERAVERLRQALASHVSGEGLWLDSRAWIVAACRR
jgi:SAM-dependent methyltransferase